jgi:hypothetical protein
MNSIKRLPSPFPGFFSLVDHEIATYKQHIRKIEALLEKEKEELERSFKESIARASSEDEAHYLMKGFGSSERYWLIAEELPRISTPGRFIGCIFFP